jgi:Rne/Rng family ribonuclease
MNKELFVSSTPHETKVGLMEDDLLAEVYLERENEYTLAGSIYKGRVTRVLPGMQSAFVDIGLERDAFLYVSDFMELEEHDEDMTDVVPAGREVPDLRRQAVRAEAPAGVADQPATGEELEHAGEVADSSRQGFDAQESHAELHTEAQPFAASGNAPQPGRGDDSQGSERGSFRGRRRRRGGRRDGRDGRDGRDRGSEQQSSRTSAESAPPREIVPPSAPSRTQESGRTQQYGPPAGYQPIMLPGESISKYQRYAQQPPAQERRSQQSPAPVSGIGSERPAPLAATFPEDEPIFAKGATIAEPLHEQHDDSRPGHEEQSETASTSVDWNREFRRQDLMSASPLARDAAATRDEVVPEGNRITTASEPSERPSEHFSQRSSEHHLDQAEPVTRQQQSPAFAAPGTMEEETIDEEEADAIRYQESSDDGYEEFEEETRAADQVSSMSQTSGQDIAEVREAVAEIHRSSLAESSMAEASTAGAGGGSSAEPGAAEGEEDSEELELEEAQAEAEALLDAEARGNGTVDAHAEVRAPAGTVGYTQRAPRPRPGFDRQGGPRGRRGGGRRFRRHEPQDVPKISDLLKEGQEILVQIAKEPIGKKGARITSHIALPGRFLVYMPTVNHTGVSRKIASDEERQRLKRIVMSERDNGHGGFIVRTAAQSASEEELRADIRFLKGLWNDIKTRSESSKPPALIYHDLNVVERVLRDQVTSDFSVIWVDTEPEYERILRFFNRFQPALVKRVKLYTKETPLFEQFGLGEEMNKALKSKVWLKSGGYIVINQTEALVAIDINTGKYVGKTSRLEDTIVKTNVDAIKEIVRQIRLRDLGGIIIIDFIDMDERRNRQRVMQALEEELRHDRAPSKVLQFNDFGLVAITRKRVKQSLERTIGAPCPYCQSTGYVKSVTTICNEIYVEMRKIAKHLEHEDVMLRVNPDVAKELKGNNGRLLNEMEELTKRTIIVKSDPAVHQEQFDIH